MVRPSKGQDGQSADNLIRAVLRKTAHVHYSKQSAQRREEVRKSFYALDTSGDGRISLEEFLQSTAEVVSNGSSRVISKIFSYVDEDKSGFLEFDEFIVVTFIMESGFQVCDNCLSPVVIAGYTCKTCWSERGHENHDTYDLCASCYIAEGFNHPASHELVETCHMYHYLLTTTSPPKEDTKKQYQVQCSVCEEYHTKNLRSLLVDGKNHVVELEGCNPQKFVCEWCASYLCNGCGRYFSEPSYHDVRTNQWLRRDLCCDICVEEGKYQPHVDSVLQLLEKSEIPKNCSACTKKIESSTSKANSTIESSSDPTFVDLITAQMENNLLLQQSYFNAAMTINYGAGLFYLAG